MPADVKVAWVTSVYGGYDAPAAPARRTTTPSTSWSRTGRMSAPRGGSWWSRGPSCIPRLAAKYAKCRPDAYADADVYIWTDANVRVADPHFIRWCLHHLGGAQIGIPRHPDAPTIAGDLELSMVQPRYSSLPMREQVAHYIKDGFPPAFGNWWTGLVVRQGVPPAFGDAWIGELARWVYHDQICLPYLLWLHGIRAG